MNKVKTGAKDFFLYFGAIGLLYFLFGSELSLIFNYINYVFPDPLNTGYYYDPYSASIRFSLAVLIILFPVFWTLTWYINKDLRNNPEKEDLSVRKWLLYLTLFIATGIVVGDLVVLVNTFLDGEITTRFVLKALSVFALSAFTIIYYFFDLKGKYVERPMLGRGMGIGAFVIVLASIILGFFVVGSPANQRLARFDQQKVDDLQNIQWQIVSYWQAKEKLPASLKDLANPISGQVIPLDTQNNKAYEYMPTGKMTFKLCADFNKDSKSHPSYMMGEPGVLYKDISISARPVASPADNNWQHGVGNVCFERTIDPELYPPYPKR